jgi:hypothetical protein
MINPTIENIIPNGIKDPYKNVNHMVLIISEYLLDY